jgi:hypothetical protein
MLELSGSFLCGFIGFLVAQLRWRIAREVPRRALLLWSAFALFFLVVFGVELALGRGGFAPVARVLAFYFGVVMGYAAYSRFWRKRHIHARTSGN